VECVEGVFAITQHEVHTYRSAVEVGHKIVLVSLRKEALWHCDSTTEATQCNFIPLS
jgi:hypothetical protein